MASGQLQTVVGQLRRLVGRRSGCTLTDAQLVDNFVKRRDQPSFEVLVWRHGALVLRLCQRILRDSHEAEDAFQATFLILARKAGSIGKRQAVGSWLYKVAYRVALRLRARAARRSAVTTGDPRGQMLDEISAPATSACGDDLKPILDEEIARLPEKFRAPLVLCYLEGQTNEEAAAQLGCPRGTVLSRLSRGRQWLRGRLSRRGITVSAVGVAVTLSQSAAAAPLPAALASSTTEAAMAFAAGQATAGLISASALALTQGVLKAMLLTKLKIAAAAVVALGVIGFGIGSVGPWAQAGSDGTPAPVRELAEVGRPEAAANAGDQAMPAGKVVDVAKDGKNFTIEIGSRDAEPKKLTFTINDKTTVLYQGVGPNGATPTNGYRAVVKPADNADTAASSVTFHGGDGGRGGPELAGKVVGIAKGGKGITLEVTPANRQDEAKKVDVQFNDKTQQLFSNVAAGGAKIAEGCVARVHLLHGAKGHVAAIVEFVGSETLEKRDDPPADVTGKIITVTQDGKTLTVQTASEKRDDPPTPPQKIDVKLNGKTATVYHQISADGTKLAVGQKTRVWLASGSKDTAAKLVVIGAPQPRWAEVRGKVVGVKDNGSTFTVEIAPKTREDEAKTLDIKLTIDTRISYSGVGPDEARVSEGYQAHVRLGDGTMDTAYQVSFTKPAKDGGGR